MSQRLLLLILFCGLASLPAFAQTYEPGFLVRSNGDTLRGEMENAFWTYSPAFIRFRRTATSPGDIFQARQLRVVRFTGGRYFRNEPLPIDYAAESRLAYLPLGYTPEIRTDSLLAEVLVEGPASLFRVVAKNTPHYVLQRAGLPALDLSEKKYRRRTPGGGQVIINANNYRSSLGVFFGDCPSASRLISDLPFTAAALAGLAQAFNQGCSTTQAAGLDLLAQSKPRRVISLQGGVLAGLRYNRVESVYNPTDAACVDCQGRPFAGLFAEVFQPGRTAAVYGELSISPFRSQGQLQFLNNATPANPYVYVPFDYRGLLGTARLGMRFFFALPHEQQWLLSAGYELNRTLAVRLGGPAAGFDPALFDRSALKYAHPTLLPNLGAGWRSKRLTISLDGQLYYGYFATEKFFLPLFFGDGKSFAVRLSTSYRLGRNRDKASQSRPEPN